MQHLAQATVAAAPKARLARLSRRHFITTTVGGATGLALMPAFAQNAAAAPGSKPTEQPVAFVTIAPDGTTTILCNRMDMGQGIETGLAMILAEELEADWSRVKTGFGDQQANYVDPAFGMHLTGGSNSIKNSYGQYRELGGRLRAMLVAAAAQAWGVKPAEVVSANGRLTSGSRSAGYGEFFAAALKQAVPEKVSLKDPKDFRLIGKPTGLTVSRAKSTGAQTYAMDVQLPGMLVAVVQRPPVFKGQVARVASEAALKVPGVKAVLTVPLDRGGQGVAVVATGYWAANKGREALQIDWQLDGVAKPDSAQLLAHYQALAQTPGTPAPQPHLAQDASAWKQAPKSLVAEYAFPYLNHAQMEPLACTVDLKADRCDAYYASQMPGLDAGAIADATGLKPDQVQIHVQMAGGGFGRRAVPSSEWPREAAGVAVALAKAGQRAPVKVIWSREDDMRAGYYRPMTVHRAEIGYDASGKVLGWQHRVVSQSIVKGSPFEGMIQKGVDPTTTEGLGEPYGVPMNLSVHHPDVNVPVLWWRSVGSTHTAFVMETLIDELAVASQQDPVAYRLKLMEGNAKAAHHRAALQAAVAKSGYGKRKLAAGRAWGVALHESFESVVAYVVVASVKGKGADRQVTLHEVHAGVHCGLCVNPKAVEAQVQGAALMALATTMPGHRITLKDGVVEQSNFHQLAMPRIPDMPRVFTVSIVPSSERPTGMGEPGLPPLAPALANAVARLTGQRQRELPFRFS